MGPRTGRRRAGQRLLPAVSRVATDARHPARSDRARLLERGTSAEGCGMRRRSTAFFLGDVSCLADPKFRALERRLPDPDDFNSAVGAFFVALARARRNGHPDLDVRAETSSRFVEDLRAVGLLNGAGFHGSSFDAWAPMTRQQAFAGQVRAESATRDATGRFVPASSSVIQRTPADQRAGTAGPSLENAGPAYPLPSIPSTEEGVQGEKPDALDAYYRLTN